MPNDARMPNDDWRKRASKASRECMHLAIRASDLSFLRHWVFRHSSLYDGRGA